MQDYIYIEAYKEIHVRNAVEGLHMIFPGKITLIPTVEMPQIYKIDKAKPINFKKGQWVRIKSGLYHDDLGMVDSQQADGKVVVRLVPRNDFSTKEELEKQKK